MSKVMNTLLGVLLVLPLPLLIAGVVIGCFGLKKFLIAISISAILMLLVVALMHGILLLLKGHLYD